jgi:IS5 family transposase
MRPIIWHTPIAQQTKQKLAIVSGDKWSHGMPNRSFLTINDFKDGLMRKSETKAKLTELEMNRKQEISQARSIVEQYFGCKSSS